MGTVGWASSAVAVDESRLVGSWGIPPHLGMSHKITRLRFDPDDGIGWFKFRSRRRRYGLLIVVVVHGEVDRPAFSWLGRRSHYPSHSEVPRVGEESHVQEVTYKDAK